MTVYCIHYCSLPDAAKIHIHHVQKLCLGCLSDGLHRLASTDPRPMDGFPGCGAGEKVGNVVMLEEKHPSDAKASAHCCPGQKHTTN